MTYSSLKKQEVTLYDITPITPNTFVVKNGSKRSKSIKENVRRKWPMVPTG
jgi:hypothetical protein